MVRLLLAFAVAFPQPVRAADVEPTFRHETLQKLLAELKDDNAMTRRQAALTLGMPDGSKGKGGPRPSGDLWPAMLALTNAQQDKDMQVRANAMKSLGLLMRYRGVGAQTEERFETISLAAIAALKDLSVPALIGTLAIEEMRPNAIYALASFGTQARAAVPALLALGRDDRGVVNNHILSALAAIDPEGHEYRGLLLAALLSPDPNSRNSALLHFHPRRGLGRGAARAGGAVQVRSPGPAAHRPSARQHGRARETGRAHAHGTDRRPPNEPDAAPHAGERGEPHRPRDSEAAGDVSSL